MRVRSRALVLDEVLRLLELPHVVVVATHARQKAVCADRVARGLAQVRHGDAVGVRTRRFRGQPPEERSVRVGLREQREVGRDPRARLHDRKQGGGERRRRERVEATEQPGASQIDPRPVRPQLHRDPCQHIRARNGDHRRQELVAPPDGANRHRCGDTTHEREEQRIHVVVNGL